MLTDNFVKRHIGPEEKDIPGMLQTVGVETLDQLIDETIPTAIRLKKPLGLPAGMNEHEYLTHLWEIASKNKVYKTFIGLGYYNTIMPGVIRRNILENPGWYTAYTPYQAEISQGRLEALLNFQTMVTELTGLDVANASLLDEGTAAAEAITMALAAKPRAKTVFVSDALHPQSIDVIRTRLGWHEVDLHVGDWRAFDPAGCEGLAAVLVQYPDTFGAVEDFAALFRGDAAPGDGGFREAAEAGDEILGRVFDVAEHVGHRVALAMIRPVVNRGLESARLGQFDVNVLRTIAIKIIDIEAWIGFGIVGEPIDA